ncbi:hypothetical protein Acsp03_12800 [Actinomadura sp. NBRC 104412]|nr:hypothetical protein [Actinomadura sp. NBRC 104412]GLZ03814.1 hypothetical protein Acsp03_12800 [Actinomadura sp. NBRC 104412]
MRIAIAALVGVLLATAASFSVVQLASSAQQDQVTEPLYNYGNR